MNDRITQYVETEALLMLMEDDPEEAEALVEELDPKELSRLYVHAHGLADLTLKILADKLRMKP